MAISLGINDLKELSLLMTEKTGYPFHDLSFSFLKRRLQLFFDKLFIKSNERFVAQLEDESFVKSMLYHIPVETTEMFRDPGFWRSLNSKVLQKINGSNGVVWFPDVASGEELMSFLIMCQEIPELPLQRIYYNHPSVARLEEIKHGLLNGKNKELNDNNFKRLEINKELDDYIELRDNSYMVKSKFLENTISVKGWFYDAPKEQVSIIIMRNVMLYMTKMMQEKVGQIIYDTLLPGGFLAIGIKENLPDYLVERLDVVDEQERIYKKPI